MEIFQKSTSSPTHIFKSLQQQQQNMGIDHLITNIEKQEKKLAESKAQVFDPSKKLNDRKVHMTHLEWYKKESKNIKIGYYDSYKNGIHRRDIDVVNHKKILTLYWKEMVDEAEKKPQKEGASFRTKSLYAGTNYRRMIEPLDIAEYYKRGGKDYINQGRPKHYKKLEQWLNETETKKSASGPNYLKKQNVESNLTKDSCFWAHVEEALISCKLLSSNELSTDHRDKESSKLIDFENYVYSLMKNYAVSPEIFLHQSSFMKWWKEHKKIIGTSYGSRLTDLMKNVKNYDLYATGELEFPESSL